MQQRAEKEVGRVVRAEGNERGRERTGVEGQEGGRARGMDFGVRDGAASARPAGQPAAGTSASWWGCFQMELPPLWTSAPHICVPAQLCP